MAAVPKTVEPVRRRELTRDAQGAVGRWRTAAGTPAAAAAAAILLAMAGLWLLSGVRPGEIARFATFEMVFVLVPGWAVYQTLWADADRFRTLVYSSLLGYVLSTAAYLVAAAGGARGAYLLFPPLVVTVALAARNRIRRFTMPDPGPPFGWGAAAGVASLGVATLVVLALWDFAANPLPRDASAVGYQEDTVWVIAFAAELLHHWPLTLPQVAGEGIAYHLLPFLHFAGAADVTGVALPVIVLRLYVAPLLVLFLLAIVLAGRGIRGSWTTGVIAGALVVLVGELFLARGFGFQGYFPYWYFASHTWLFGLVFFVGGIAIMSTLLTTATTRRDAFALQALVALFVLGMLGSKGYATALVLAGGGIAYAALVLVRRRRIIPAPLILAVVVAAATALMSAFYLESRTGGGKFVLGGNIRGIPAVRTIAPDVDGWPLEGLILALYATIGLFGGTVIAGTAILLVARRGALSARETWPLCVFLSTLPALYMVAAAGWSHLFISGSGMVAGALVAAEGLRFGGRSWTRSARRNPALALVVPAVAALGLGVAWLVSLDADWTGSPALVLTGLAALVIAALALLFPVGGHVVAGIATAAGALLLLGGATPFAWALSLTDRIANGPPLRGDELAGVDIGIGAAAAAIAALGAVMLGVALALGLRLGGGSRLLPAVALGAALALVLGGAVGTGFKWGEPIVAHLRDGDAVHTVDRTALTPSFERGLDWIRESTPTDATLAVFNTNPRYFYYSAFAERRVVLEAWDYTPQVAGQGRFNVPYELNPFPRRTCLEREAIDNGEPNAIAALRYEFGADYLVVDRRTTRPRQTPDDVARLVFSNSEIAVYRIPNRPTTFTPDGVPRLLGYWNPRNPFDTGRPNEQNGDRLASWLQQGGGLASSVGMFICPGREAAS